MTITHNALSELLEALKAGEATDTVRSSLAWILQELIEAELTATIGALPNERTETRRALRNGHRPKLLTTQAGDIEVKIPKLRSGAFFPSILERRRRIDRALFAVVMEAYVHGVTTRRVDELVKALGAETGISKSEVSRICSELDAELEAFRNRPLDGPFPYVFADATYVWSHQLASSPKLIYEGNSTCWYDVSYSNGSQRVNPWTGQTVPNADPWAHWPWSP